MENSFDIICIGGGSGGLACARKAAKLGKRAAIIEKSLIGGTCVNHGCVPKKIIYTASVLFREMELARDCGVGFDHKTMGWKLLKEKIGAYIKRLNDIYSNNCKKENVTYIEGSAKFVSPHELEVTDPKGGVRVLTAPHIVIATGSKSLMPGKLPGIQHTFGSDGFFALEELPKQLFIIGGGYIGVELSCMLSSFGVKVTICMLETSIVWPFDREVTKMQMEIMKKSGVDIITEARVMGVEKLGDKHYRVSFEKSPPVEAEAVMCAMGRVPNLDGLGVEKIGLKLTVPTRAVETDEFENTNVPGVYAIGDVNAKLMLTPVAVAAGRYLALRLFAGMKDAKLNYDSIPSVVFSYPPMTKCGLTEEEAVAKYGKDKIKVYRSQFNQLYFSMTENKVPTLMKLVCVLPEEKVVGVHGVGKGMDEVIQGFSVGVKLGMCKKDLDLTVGVHPTAAEEFVTMT